MLDADFPTMQERLIATTALSGAHFELDNRTLYDEFKPLVVDGPGWSLLSALIDPRMGEALNSHSKRKRKERQQSLRASKQPMLRLLVLLI